MHVGPVACFDVYAMLFESFYERKGIIFAFFEGVKQGLPLTIRQSKYRFYELRQKIGIDLLQFNLIGGIPESLALRYYTITQVWLFILFTKQ